MPEKPLREDSVAGNQPIKVVACEVLKEELLAVAPSGLEFQYVSMGLHTYPDKLRQELQSILDQSVGYERIILAFGLCGGAASGLLARHTIVTIPRVHDCIPLFLGSTQRYEELHQTQKGTFYHTCGWVSDRAFAGKSFLSEHRRIVQRHGEAKAKSILKRMYDSYTRVLFIATQNSEIDTALARSREMAGILNLQHERTNGDSAYLAKIVNGPWDDNDFINLSPQQAVDEFAFLAMSQV